MPPKEVIGPAEASPLSTMTMDLVSGFIKGA